MRNKNLLDSLYCPNDRLGVEMFGVNVWNNLKNNVCAATNELIDGRFVPSCSVDCYEYAPLFDALFVPNRQAMREMLGASAPVDFLPSVLRDPLSKIGSGITNALNQIPFFTPWIAAGRQINAGVSSGLENWFGLSSKKAEELAPTVTKAGLGIGGLLLIGGGVYLVYKLSQKKKRGRK